MSKNCKIVYLDENGQESKVYLDNLDKGEDVAKKLYLDSMAGLVSTKFQKGNPNSKYTKVPKTDDELFADLEQAYKELDKVEGRQSNTDLVAEVVGYDKNTTEVDMATMQLMAMKRNELYNDPRKKDSPNYVVDEMWDLYTEERKEEVYRTAKDDAALAGEDYFSDYIDPRLSGENLRKAETLVKSRKEEKETSLTHIIEHYAMQRKYGSEMHGVLELYIKLRQEYLEGKKDYTNKLSNDVKNSLINYAYKQFYSKLEWKTDEKTGRVSDNIAKINEDIKLDKRFFSEDPDVLKKLGNEVRDKKLDVTALNIGASALIDNLNNLERFLRDQGEGASFKTEFKLGDKDFKVRGIADLIVVRKDGTILPVDYKTKTSKGGEVSKISLFRSTDYGVIGGNNAFASRFKNKETEVSIQLTAIKETLEKNGFKNRVLDPVAILITGNFETDLSKSPGRYTDFKFQPLTPISVKREFRNHIKNTRGYEIEEDKTVGYNGAINIVRDLVGGPSGEYNSEESKTARINASMDSIRMVEVPGAIEPEYYFRGPNSESIKIPEEHVLNRETRRAYVKEFLENSGGLDNAELTARSVIQFFNEKASGITDFTSVKNREMASKYNKFLAGIDPNFYNIKPLKDYEGFGDAENSNILVAEHKTTKSLQLIEVAGSLNRTLNFNRSSNRNTVFGSYLKDGSVSNLFDFKGLKNNYYNAGLLRLSLVAIQLANNPNYGGIEKLTVGSPTLSQSQGNIITAVPQDMAKNLEVLKYIIDQNSEDFLTPEIKDLLGDEKIFKEGFYKSDPIASWYSYLIDFDIKSAESFANTTAIQNLKTHYEENLRDGGPITQETRDLIYNSILRLKQDLQTQDEFEKNEHAQQLVKAFVHAENIPMDIVESVNAMEFIGGTMQGSRNETIKALNRYINTAKLQTLDKGINFLTEHGRAVKELKKKAGIITNRFAFEDAGMLNDMLVEGYKDKKGDWLHFKKDEELTTYQKKYKKYFQKILRETLWDSKEAYDYDIKEGNWDVDRIPAIPASKTNAIKENWKRGKKGETINLIFDSFGRTSRDNTEGDQIYEFHGDPVNAHTYKNTVNREKLLGQAEYGSNETKKDAETNLETILNYLVMKKIYSAEQKKTVVAASAIHASINMEKEFNHKTTDPLFKYLNDIVKLNVLKTVDKPTPAEAVAEKTFKSISTGALFASAGLFSVEMVTSVLGTLNSGIDNVLRGFVGNLFKSTGLKPRYSNVAYYKRAAKLITFQEGAKTVAIDRLYGISTVDPQYMTQKMSETKNKSLLNKQRVYELMSFASRGMRRQMLVARMDIDGVYDAHSYDKETDSISYDPKKDPRLFIEEVEGHAPRTDLEKKKAAYYRALKAELEKEGFVKKDEKGNDVITRPYTTQEINRIKEHADIQYGSLDGEEKANMEKYAIARAFLVLKKFIIPKIKVYWRGDAGKYGGRAVGDFEYDEETGEYLLNTTPEEGIIQTFLNLGKLINNMYLFGRDESLTKNGAWKDTMKRFWNTNRAGNMTKFMSDMTMLLIGYLVTAGLSGDDEDEGWLAESVYGKAIMNGIKNATMDYNIVSSIINIFEGDSLIGLSILIRAFQNLTEGIWNSPDAEFHYDSKYILKALDGMSGVFRTGHGAVELITPQ